MRLSEHEQRVLAEIEAGLVSADPRFVRQFGQRSDPGLGSTPRLPERGRVRRALSVLVHWWA